MYKEDLALNNLQWLICHKTKPSQLFRRILPLCSVYCHRILSPAVLSFGAFCLVSDFAKFRDIS